MQAVALEARQRVYGLTKTQAEAEEATDFLGRLWLSREISRRQFDTGREYQKVSREYDALHPIKGFTKAGDMDRGGGFDSGDGTDEAYVRRFHAVSLKMLGCQRALVAIASVDAHARQILNNVLLNGYEMPAHIPSLRIALNAVARPLDIP